MRVITLTSAAVLVVAGCSGGGVVNTGEWATFPTQAAPQAAQLPPVDSAHMANAFDFVGYPNDLAAYYFASPSGRWQCAILPRDKAGCQATGGGALSIAGAPETVTDAEGDEVAPNAIVIEPEGDAQFVALDEPEFSPPQSATVLPFNRTLIAALFRCNVQEATGVSCLSEQSGKGFTFSADGFNLQYSEVPLDAP
jgi:hypothetical protein